VRALIVGGGRRGLRLAEELTGEGHAVRVVSRTGARDPDRIGTLRYALDNVTLLLWLLGTATGDPERVAALHGSRLEMMLERTVDTTVRGVVYEAAGTLAPEIYASGLHEMRRANERNEVPFAVLDADPRDPVAWRAAAHAAIASLLGPRG